VGVQVPLFAPKAGVVELADTAVSKAAARKGIGVRLPSSAPTFLYSITYNQPKQPIFTYTDDMDAPTVGATIWYRKEYGGRLFNQAVVAGETSRSWIVRRPDAPAYEKGIKLPKNGEGWTLGTERDAKLALWAVENQRNVTSLLEAVAMTNATLFAQVAKLIGYDKLPDVLPTEALLDGYQIELKKLIADGYVIQAIKRGREIAYEAGADSSLLTVKKYIDRLRGL
jgi:hypothetical protein